MKYCTKWCKTLPINISALKDKVSNNFMCHTAQKMKFSIKDFCNKCHQTSSFLQIWSHLLKKSLMESFIFCAVSVRGKATRHECLYVILYDSILHKIITLHHFSLHYIVLYYWIYSYLYGSGRCIKVIAP